MKKERTEAQKLVDKKFGENAIHFTSESAREAQIKSAEQRKKNTDMRRSMQQTVKVLLSKALKKGVTVDSEDILSIADAEGQNLNAQDAIILAQIARAIAGDTKSAEFVRDTLGEKPVEQTEVKMTMEDYVKEHKPKF